MQNTHNLIRIIAIIIVMPLWILVMYEGVVKRGFDALTWL